MAELHIPFTQGQHEEVDAKLLPQGLFTVAQNVRYRKDARLAVRNAYRHDAGNAAFTEANVRGVGRFDDQHSLVLLARTGVTTPPQWAQHIYTRYATPYTLATSDTVRQQAGSIGVPTLVPVGDGILPQATHEISACDCTVIGGFLFVVMCAYDNSTKLSVNEIQWANGYLYVYKIDPSTGAIVTAAYLGSDVATNVKVVNISGTVGIFYAVTATDRVRFIAKDTSLTVTLFGPLDVVTTSAGRAPYFDVAPGLAASNALLAYQATGTTVAIGRVDAAGVFSLDATIAGLTGPENRPSICASGLNPTRDIATIVLDGATFTTGTAKYAVYNTSSLTFTTAITALSVAFPYVALGYPTIASSSVADWTAAFNGSLTNGLTFDAMVQTTAGAAGRIAQGVRVASKPFPVSGSSFIGILATESVGTATFPGSYYVYDNDTPAGKQDPCTEGSFARNLACPADATAIRCDPRRNLQVVAAVGDEPGISAVMAVLPIRTDVKSGWALVRVESGGYEEMFQTARLNGQMFVSGARLLEYDGATLIDAGLSTPTLTSVGVTLGGSIAAGTYSVVAVYEWVDALGYRHRSPPSLPLPVTLGVTESIVATVTPNIATIRNLIGSNGFISKSMNCRLYRTLAGGTVYYDSLATLNLSGGSFAWGYSLTATASDATVATQEVLYTQGARGGLSGILQNDVPPPARYVWAGSDRVIIGHTDRPTQYQMSKLRFVGEPINWSNTPAFTGNVDAPITGVAEMDGVWYVFTRDAVWTVTGDGPDDNGAGGSFDVARRLPSNIGCLRAASLLLTGQGLYFQGAADRLFLLPRGGGDPQFIGQPIRDTLAAFPFITSSAFDEDSGLCYFSCIDSAGTSGRLLVYDTRIGEWSVDNFLGRAIRSLSIFGGLLVIDGSIVESTSNYQDSDGSTTANVLPTLTTGDIRPFGQGGTGRVRKTWLLGEARDVATAYSVTLDVSYDSGKTFAESVSWPIANLALAIGDAINGAEHMLAQPRLGGNIRLRWSWSTPTATEGIVFNGMSLDAYQTPGLKRLGQSART